MRDLSMLEVPEGPLTRPADTPLQAQLRRLAVAASYAVTVPPPRARLARHRAYREFLAVLEAVAEDL